MWREVSVGFIGVTSQVIEFPVKDTKFCKLYDLMRLFAAIAVFVKNNLVTRGVPSVQH